MRRLDPEEAELWARVTATIRPLSREPVAVNPPAPLTPKLPPVPLAPRAKGPSPRLPPPPLLAPRKPHTDATLDGSWDRKLTKGTVVPDRTLDLHGHNLDGAWDAIDQGLERAIAAGDRVVLLITGHYRSGEPPVVRGRIRAAVHDWLAHSRHARHIAAVRGAHPRHGGGGSLYLILRRPR
ncbi:Smr/MutS family protein [Sphingomonas sp.]|uniref:Smr/MutS family protein n=1 Tax=Sphingomonas sp. TaxID=28214 RepID=UPI00286B08AB|nr:Smr/MutS family protein [Sphingomonas sp.]